MVSDSDTDSEGTEMEEERESESMGSGGMESHEESSSSGQEMAAESVASSASKTKSKGGGRRAALRILRENVDSVSKDLAGFRKTHEASSKKLDKQVSSLRNEVASLKSFISKENARSKAKQEALLNRVIAKVNVQKSKVAAVRAKRKSAPKKPKGKK